MPFKLISFTILKAQIFFFKYAIVLFKISGDLLAITTIWSPYECCDS